MGRKPKERDRYVIRMEDGTLVDVSREVYLEWYQSRRKERYQQEKKQKYKVCNFSAWNEINIKWPNYVQEGVEETALRNIYRDKMKEVLKQLSTSDAFLMDLLYNKEVTITDAAVICRCSRKTIQNHRKRILRELSQIMQAQDICKEDF